MFRSQKRRYRALAGNWVLKQIQKHLSYHLKHNFIPKLTSLRIDFISFGLVLQQYFQLFLFQSLLPPESYKFSFFAQLVLVFANI